MINFGGDWYWGIDRVDHIEKRLLSANLAYSKKEQVLFNLTYKGFCKTEIIETLAVNDKQPLILYWPARSPYSYIGLERAILLAQNYQIPQEIKPVLPMMMRNMQVPETKKTYIFSDAKREASKLSIPYGFVADPLGIAVERCYAIIDYARSNNKLQAFLLSFARGVNVEGIRADTDAGLKKIINRCGLDWSIARSQLHNKTWHAEVQDNLSEMLKLGCRGVPTISYGETHFWGQDRFVLLENVIRKSFLN